MAELVWRFKEENPDVPEAAALAYLKRYIKNVEEYVVIVGQGRTFVHSAADANADYGVALAIAFQTLIEERYA